MEIFYEYFDNKDEKEKLTTYTHTKYSKVIHTNSLNFKLPELHKHNQNSHKKFSNEYS